MPVSSSRRATNSQSKNQKKISNQFKLRILNSRCRHYVLLPNILEVSIFLKQYKNLFQKCYIHSNFNKLYCDLYNIFKSKKVSWGLKFYISISFRRLVKNQTKIRRMLSIYYTFDRNWVFIQSLWKIYIA